MRAFSCSAALLLVMVCLPVKALHAADERQARKLINAQGCKACHTLEGNGGSLAGSLEEVTRGLNIRQLREALVNPRHVHGDGRIPDFRHLKPGEIEALTNFLKQLGTP